MCSSELMVMQTVSYRYKHNLNVLKKLSTGPINWWRNRKEISRLREVIRSDAEILCVALERDM